MENEKKLINSSHIAANSSFIKHIAKRKYRREKKDTTSGVQVNFIIIDKRDNLNFLIEKKAHKLAIVANNTYSNIIKKSNCNLLNIEENMVKEYAKSHSNTSTTSVESGIFDMEVPLSKEEQEMEKMTIGEVVERILIDANKCDRLIAGLNSAVKHLNDTETPEDTLFMFMAPTRDPTAHMSTTLLKAFCFENDIYIIQLDNADKLAKIINCKEAQCALVQRATANKNEVCNVLEEVLIDHCEDFWDEIMQPVIKLPEK